MPSPRYGRRDVIGGPHSLGAGSAEPVRCSQRIGSRLRSRFRARRLARSGPARACRDKARGGTGDSPAPIPAPAEIGEQAGPMRRARRASRGRGDCDGSDETGDQPHGQPRRISKASAKAAVSRPKRPGAERRGEALAAVALGRGQGKRYPGDDVADMLNARELSRLRRWRSRTGGAPVGAAAGLSAPAGLGFGPPPRLWPAAGLWGLSAIRRR